MPVKLKKVKVQASDIDGNSLTFDAFRVQMFTGFVNIMYFFMSEYGWFDALELFQIGEYIEIVDSVENGVHPDSTYIKLSSGYLRVLTSALQSNYVQSMVGTIVDALRGSFKFDEVTE